MAKSKIGATGGIDFMVNEDWTYSERQVLAEPATAEKIHDSDSFLELYEESLKSIREGEIVRGGNCPNTERTCPGRNRGGRGRSASRL